MAKLKALFKSAGKATKGVRRGAARKAIKAKKLFGVKGKQKGLARAAGGLLGKSQVKGKNVLAGTAKAITDIRTGEQRSGITKVNRLVETKVNNLLPKLTNRIENQVNTFDPNAMLGKIFDGGLGKLQGFGQSLDGLRGSMAESLGFLGKSKGLIEDLINKLASGKFGQRRGGGLVGNLLKGAAALGVVALGSKLLAPAAVIGGAAMLGKKLWGGITGLFKRKKKKKEVQQLPGVLDKNQARKFNESLKNFEVGLDRMGGEPTDAEGLQEKEESPGQEQVKAEKEKIEIPEEFKDKYEITFQYRDGRYRFINYKEKGLPEGQSYKGSILMEGDTKADQSTWELIYKKEKAREIRERPKGTKRFLAGIGDALTGNIFDFDKRGNVVDGLKRGLKGFKGSKGTEGTKGARGHQGPQGIMRHALGMADLATGNIFDFDKRGNLLDGAKRTGETLKEKTKGLTKKPKGFMRFLKGAMDAVTGDAFDFDGRGSMLDGAKRILDKNKDDATAVSQPAVPPPTQEAGGNQQVIPIQLDGMAATPPNQGPRPAPTDVKTSNKVPFLIAMDISNIHVPYSRSIFNIVDAS